MMKVHLSIHTIHVFACDSSVVLTIPLHGEYGRSCWLNPTFELIHFMDCGFMCHCTALHTLSWPDVEAVY